MPPAQPALEHCSGGLVKSLGSLLVTASALLLVASIPVTPTHAIATPLGHGSAHDMSAPAGPGQVLTVTVESGSVILTGQSSVLTDEPAPHGADPAGAGSDPAPGLLLHIDTRTTLSTRLPHDGDNPRVQALNSRFPVTPTVAGYGDGSSRRGARATTSLAASANAMPVAAAADSSLVQSSTAAAQPETVTAQTEIPVLIVHGTFSNTTEVEPLKANLESRGLTVYSYNYGHAFSLIGLLYPTVGGIQNMNLSVEDLAAQISRAKAETGSDQIDLVGHSQGGLLVKDYLAHYPDDGVRKVVDLAATNHGTTFGGGAETLLNAFAPGLVDPLNAVFGKSAVRYFLSGNMLFDVVALFPGPLQPVVRWLADRVIDVVLGVAPRQQLLGSAFIDALDQTPDTKPGVDYLVIATRDDDWVTPYQSTYLKAVIGAQVRNVEVHSLPGVRPDEVILHDDLLTNKPVADAVADFLTYPSPAPDPDIGTTTTVDGGTTTIEQVSETAADSADAISVPTGANAGTQVNLAAIEPSADAEIPAQAAVTATSGPTTPAPTAPTPATVVDTVTDNADAAAGSPAHTHRGGSLKRPPSHHRQDRRAHIDRRTLART